jgi:hypothetical protein
MAKLTAAKRKRIPSSEFGLSQMRKYPMPDATHARVAKSYASKEYDEGRLSASQKATIDRKANAKLGKRTRRR